MAKGLEKMRSRQFFTRGQHLRQLILLIGLILFLGVVFLTYTLTTPNIEDSIGYIYAGERLATGHGPTYEDSNNLIAGPYFSMSAFQIRRDDDSRMFLGFPPGYPLLLALGISVAGTDEAAHYVVPVMALLGVVLTFFLGKLLSGEYWVGFWAALFIGFAPDYWEFGTSAWSEIPATTIMMLGLLLFLLSFQGGRSRRSVVFLSISAALLLGYSFFIRYANLAIVPAIIVYEIVAKKIQILRERERWPFYIFLGVCVLGILVFNNYYYGGPFLTSYSPEHGWYPNAPFSLQYIFGRSFIDGQNFIQIIKTLWGNFPVALILVPVGWILLPRPSGAFAVTATLTFLGLYSLYAFSPVGVNSRFLISAFPFMVIAIGQSLNSTGQLITSKPMRRLAGVALFVLLCIRLPEQVRTLESRNTGSETIAQFADNLANRTEQDAVLLTYAYNDRVAYFGNRSVLNYRRIPISDPEENRYRLEMLEPCLVESIDALLVHDVPVYYVEDRSPPFWDSLKIVQDNYSTELVSESPAMYRIGNRSMMEEAGESLSGDCYPPPP
jgi:hypothetical protein